MKKILSILMFLLMLFNMMYICCAINENKITVSDLKCINDKGERIFSVKKGEDCRIEFYAQNNFSETVRLYIYAAAYAENGKMSDIFKTSEDVLADGQSKLYSIPWKATSENFDSIKVMIFDDELYPYTNFDDLVYNDGIYSQINLTPVANGKFYVVPDNAEELLLSTYNNGSNMAGRHDFAWHNEGIGNKVAAVYPLKAADGSSILNDKDGMLYAKSGVKYKVPERFEGVSDKEAISLSYWYSGNIEIDVENDAYSKLHFLLASAFASTSESRFDVKINYTDGSTELTEAIPVYGYSNAANQEGFVTYLSKKAALNGTDLNNSVGGYVKLALVEQTVEANPNKIVDSITVGSTDPAKYTASSNAGGRTFMIAALTVERPTVESMMSYVENKLSSSKYLSLESQALGNLISAMELRGVKSDEINGFEKLPEYGNTKREIFVSTNGDDVNGNGSIDFPFASVEKACEFIKENADYIGGWSVVFRGGRYYIKESIELNNKTLPKFSSIVFCAYNNEDVIISGACEIDMTKADFVNGAIKDSLPEAAKEKVVCVDLSEQGITDIIKPTAVKYGASRSNANQLIIDDKIYEPARWPNSGYATISTCINNGSNGKGLSFTADTTGSNASFWGNAKDALINGFFSDNDWRFDIMKMASYDISTKAIVTADSPYTTIGSMSTPRRFFIENLLEEIDSPGEWYIDKDNILYIYPTNEEAKVYINKTDDTLFSISDISNISFENICVNGTMGIAFSFKNAKNCTIKNCDIKNITNNAVVFSSCEESGIESCNLSYIGRNAVYIYESETSFVRMKPKNIYVKDCKISNFATFSRNGSAAAIYTAYSHGTKISNNEIFDAPWAAIVMDKPIGTVIEYNDIHNVQKDYGDAGAIYCGLSFIPQGNKIQYNYIHDLEPYNENISGYLSAVYMDDMCSGFTIHGNIIYRSPIGILLGGGKNLTVSNNIIMNGNVKKAIYTINADDRGLNWASASVKSLTDELKSYIMYYPQFAEKYENVKEKYYYDSYSGAPTSNKITKNFYYNSGSDSVCDNFKSSNYNNTYSGNYKYGDNLLDSWIYGSPFVDEKNCNFSQKSNSVINKRISGFETIDFNKMGLINKR